MNSDSFSPILLFDGVCNLCNTSVQWVLKYDKKGVFRFAALQSETGGRLMQEHGFDPAQINTVICISNGKVYSKSDAPLEIVRVLGFPWILLYAFRVIPQPLRNAVYDWIARNRYRWFGKRAECMLPKPAWKERFL